VSRRIFSAGVAIALGLGVDPSFRAPMAIAVIGGLVTSTFLSLLVIPGVTADRLHARQACKKIAATPLAPRNRPAGAAGRRRRGGVCKLPGRLITMRCAETREPSAKRLKSH
jgi:hypothetical protein